MEWQTLHPDDRHTWLTAQHAEEFGAFLPMGMKEAKSASQQNTETIFKIYSLGVSTNRDDVVYDFDRGALERNVEQFCDAYSAELDHYRRKGKDENLDNFLDYSKVKWSRNLKRSLRNGEPLNYVPDSFRDALYRPFVRQYLYFVDIAVDELGQFPRFFPTLSSEAENRVICAGGYGRKEFAVLVARKILNLNFYGDPAQCFPFYVYDEDGSNRRENITDWALEQFRDYCGDKKISKWDIFYYAYGMLHHPGYRERFADNLKRDLPRIPFAADFRAFAAAGQKLAQLHLDYEKLEPYPLKWGESPSVPLSYRVDDKMRLSKDKTSLQVNDSLTLAGIPPEVFQYRLGNRSVLEWVIDQYQATQDERSGIQSDPNQPDDEEYIVRLVAQVVRVSLETVKVVQGLPADWSENSAP